MRVKPLGWDWCLIGDWTALSLCLSLSSSLPLSLVSPFEEVRRQLSIGQEAEPNETPDVPEP